MSLLLIFIVVFILVVMLSTLLIKQVIRYSEKHALISVPNERSSHSVPTPSGGGIVISGFLLLVFLLLAIFGLFPVDIGLLVCAGIFIVTVVGWIDDHHDLPSYVRFFFYSVAAASAIYEAGGVNSLSFGVITIRLPEILGWIVAFLAIVWLTNLYNFMDGTDGLAAIQAICASTLGGLLLFVENQYGLAFVCLIIMASSMGFLYWNFPPAKIFMGDVGSCVLGFIFAILALLSDAVSSVSVVIWCMLLSFFICDATFTLIQRIARGERWYTAHRDHAYQSLVKMGVSHKKLALLSLALHTAVVWPLVLVAYIYPALKIVAAFALIAIMLVIWLTIQNSFQTQKKNL